MIDRYFELADAQALVPWLQETFNDLAPLVEQLNQLNTEIRALLGRMRSNGGADAAERLSSRRRELRQTSDLINEQIEAIQERGILVRDVGSGLLDFPSMREGREVYLCWVSGEARIGFWHEVDTGFAARQPL